MRKPEGDRQQPMEREPSMKVNEELNAILRAAYTEAKAREHEYLTPEHVLFASLYFDTPKEIILRCGGDVEDLRERIENFFTEKLKSILGKGEYIFVGSRNLYHRLVIRCIQ